MDIRWSKRATDDLLEIGRYIAKDDRAAARQWVARLKERVTGAARTPRAGRRVPEFDRDEIREVIEGNYRIVYRAVPRGIEVLTVFEGHRTLRLDASAIPGGPEDRPE